MNAPEPMPPCDECGHTLIDAGIVGVECVNWECPGNVRTRNALRNIKWPHSTRPELHADCDCPQCLGPWYG